MAKSWHFIISHKTRHGTLWYYGKHRWARRPSKGKFFHYNKATKGFYPNKTDAIKYAYAKSKGLKGLIGLKAFWGAYRYRKYGLR